MSSDVVVVFVVVIVVVVIVKVGKGDTFPLLVILLSAQDLSLLISKWEKGEKEGLRFACWKAEQRGEEEEN